MCSVRCKVCDQLLYAKKVVANTLRTMGNSSLTEDVLVCHSCGVIGEIDLLGNSLDDITNNIHIIIKS